MLKIQNSKQYDLEERTLQFAQQCRELVKQLPRTIGNIEDCKQLVRSSGSVHSSYIEANESLSKKDYYHRVKTCRKEIKESRSWLRLIDIGGSANLDDKRENLIRETTELMRIFGSIIDKGKGY
jgi:four helix bundle protein